MGYCYDITGCLRLREKWKGRVNEIDIQRIFKSLAPYYIDVSVSQQVLPQVHISLYNKWAIHCDKTSLTIIAEFFNGYIEVVGEDFIDDGRLFRITFDGGKIEMTYGRIVYDGVVERIKSVQKISENIEEILNRLKQDKFDINDFD